MPWLNQNSAGSCHNRGCVVSGPPWGEGGEGWGHSQSQFMRLLFRLLGVYGGKHNMDAWLTDMEEKSSLYNKHPDAY